MKKKLLGMLFVLGLLLVLPSVVSFADAYGTCGATDKDNVYWELAERTLTISGTGAMKDYASKSQPWADYLRQIQTVTIENGVTNIGAYAFCDCTNLKSVTIPEGVTSIGESAFYNCRYLTSVTIPEGVTSVGDSAFGSCTRLKSVKIPANVTAIENNTFKDCVWLASVEMPENIVSIGDSAFNNCSKLTKINIPSKLSRIGDHAFCKCKSLTSVNKLLSKVTRIENGTFEGCTSLELVTIPKSVTSVGNNAFKGCTSLKSVTIPEGVTSIEDNTFNGCTSLISLAIPDGVTNIGSGVFSGCTSLELVTIPKSVTSVGDNAFKDCTSLKSVIIPEGVTSIGDNAFSGCVKLTAIYIPEGCSVGTSAIPYVNYRVEHTTKNKDIDDEKIVVITGVTKSDTNDPIELNCDSMGNGYYIIENEAGKGVELSTVCESNGTTHTGYSMRRREEITDKDHVYGCVIEKDGLYSRRCIDCGDVQKCSENGKPVTLGGLTYQCYTCGGDVKVVELNL